MIFESPKKRIDKNVTIIIRGVGERTENSCKKLLSEQIASANIHLIHENPFAAALKKSFEIGISENRKWTMVIDADVLVKSNILFDLYLRAEKNVKEVFAVQTEMLDKVFGGIRVGGIKVYRTSLLEKAIKLIPVNENRPETFVIKNMHKSGNYVDITNLVCGMHDFEQYYSDIFRKGFTHAIKSEEFVDILMPYWVRESKKDKDFLVLIKGYEVGSKYEGVLHLDKDEVKDSFEKVMKELKMNEKEPLPQDSYSSERVNALLNTFNFPAEYEKAKKVLDKKGRPAIPENKVPKSGLSILKSKLGF